MKKINLLNVSNVSISVEGNNLLKNLNLKAKTGDVIAIIGPNGAGKSSFLKTIMHHYAFKVTKGDIKFNNKSIKNASTDEIAKLGFFYLAQSPMELEGVKLIDLYKIIANAHSDKKIDPISLHNLVAPKFSELNMDLSLLKRNNNVNFSGGQKKKNELVQMFLMKNNVLLLDEVDSGCDVDSLKIIAREINKIKKSKIIILISHQEQLLKQIKPTKYITIANNKIVDSGNGNKLFNALKTGFSKYAKTPEKKLEMESLKDVF
ncbi:MAG: ATP-binding cassette domain-containing protein [Mycoplasmoidaceae bacterium]|nr:ATP-binding cassette domain-containing protein [Mycoplasmoidaceae bacterium]